MKDAKKLLEEKGISPSLQRVIILKYLLGHRNHPTSEEVYQALSRQIPTLSRTTVYNTLKVFSKKGLIHQIAICGNEMHYETQPGFHAHFQCIQCGGIFDIDLDCAKFDIEECEGHKITEYELTLRGICRKCRED